MRLRRLRPVLACCAGLLLVAAVQFAVLRPGKSIVVQSSGAGSKPMVLVPGVPKVGGATPPSKDFTIEGNVGGLFPGGTKQIVLTIRNPNRQDIVVTGLKTVVGDAGLCAATNVWVTNFRGQLRVGAQNRIEHAIPIGMIAGAGNECKEVTFPLIFSGTAEMR